MFTRVVYESFRRQRRRKLLAGIAIALGVSVATAMIAVATGIGDKISRELRVYGANLVVYPDSDALEVEIGGTTLKPATDGSFLRESDLPNIKGIFWGHNIIGFAPALPGMTRLDGDPVQVLGTYFHKQLKFGIDTFTTGAPSVYPWWKVSGAWPQDDAPEALLGEQLARATHRRAGDMVTLGDQRIRITGVLSTGGAEDRQVVAPLALVQRLLGRPGAVGRVYVSALTKPEDAFARRNPDALSPADRDRWYCSPYANSIAYQLQEAIPHSRAEQIRQVAQNEGKVLERIRGLMLLVTMAALLASGLAVSAAMATGIFERRREVGLMRALGARNAAVASFFLAEAAVLALLGGGAGYLAGSLLAGQIGRWVFHSRIVVAPVLFPIVLGIAVLVTFAGSVAAIRQAVRFDPVTALRGDA